MPCSSVTVAAKRCETVLEGVDLQLQLQRSCKELMGGYTSSMGQHLSKWSSRGQLKNSFRLNLDNKPGKGTLQSVTSFQTWILVPTRSRETTITVLLVKYKELTDVCSNHFVSTNFVSCIHHTRNDQLSPNIKIALSSLICSSGISQKNLNPT